MQVHADTPALNDEHVHEHTYCTCVHVHTSWQGEACMLMCLTWPNSLETRGSIITHVPPSRQPPTGLHSALPVLTWPDMLVARGSCKPTIIVVAANWLCVGRWVTARSAMADTFFPLVSEKAQLSPLLRPQPATEPHMAGHVGLARPASPSDGSPHPTHSGESRDSSANRIGLGVGICPRDTV